MNEHNENKKNSSMLWSALVRWSMLVVGFASLLWFLLRVIPKPSRAMYPCQQAAFPVASAFVVWLLGVIGGVTAFKRMKVYIFQTRITLALICLSIVLALGWASFVNMPLASSQAAYKVPDSPNDPMGVARGINPGRVSWIHDPDATDWDGVTGYWLDPGNTDPTVVYEMVSRAIRALAGETTDIEAWNAVFKHFNNQHGKGQVGYQAGEKVAIKINLVATGSRVDASGYQNSYLQYVNPTREMVAAVLWQLVNVAGVDASDIYIGDSTCVFPGQLVDYLTSQGFGSVNFMTSSKFGPFPGRTMIQQTTTPFYWSTADANGTDQDYILKYYEEAEYFINFATLKSHGAAVTLCGKNHYGSLVRRPDDSPYYNLHESIPGNSPNMGSYRAMVDLMGHEHHGGKALLYIMDGLWTGYGWASTSPPFKFRSRPFNTNWPSTGQNDGDFVSSVLMSQDGIAMDSVCYDIWYEEGLVSWDYFPFTNNNSAKRHWPQLAAGDDYLHEGAMANAPESGSFYDPENDGERLQSLGTHEHWNNPAERLYSRNLGSGNGIELIYQGPTMVAGRYIFYNNSYFDGDDAAANATDDAAIATDKQVLLPGQTASFANYTSYLAGINGVMVDIVNLASSSLTASDFSFKTGNDNNPSGWSTAPLPTITIRVGEGNNASDRIVLTWADDAITKKWLQVKILANANTGLRTDDVFYVGNAVGDCGDLAGNAIVNATDEISARNNPRNFMKPAAIDDVNDFNRDGKVDATDQIIARNNTTDFSDDLELITAP